MELSFFCFVQEEDPSQLKKRHLDFLDILLTARKWCWSDGSGNQGRS